MLRSVGDLQDEKRSETLWSEIQSLLGEVGKTINDLSLFGVCTGPGGFTGLRVGISAVKGLSVATDKPIIGVTSLEASAVAAEVVGLVYVLVNAYKDEVYSQLFSFDGDGLPQSENEPIVSNYQEALKRVSDVDEMILAGDAVGPGMDTIGDFVTTHQKGKWVVNKTSHQLAVAIARVAYVKHSRTDFDTAKTLKACYVRPSEAEIKLSLGLLGSKIKRSMRPEQS